MSSKNAIKEVALKLEAPKNRVYKLYTECVFIKSERKRTHAKRL